MPRARPRQRVLTGQQFHVSRLHPVLHPQSSAPPRHPHTTRRHLLRSIPHPRNALLKTKRHSSSIVGRAVPAGSFSSPHRKCPGPSRFCLPTNSSAWAEAFPIKASDDTTGSTGQTSAHRGFPSRGFVHVSAQQIRGRISKRGATLLESAGRRP